MCDKLLLNELLMKLTDYSKGLFGNSLNKIILYGAYARGDYDSESDIDVMIIVDMMPEKLSEYLRDVSDYCADLNLENDVFISPMLQSVQQFDKWKNALPFYRNIMTEGIRVYG